MRFLCLIWSALWFIFWFGTAIVPLNPHARAWEQSLAWFRTGALFAAWAGIFAWKALERPGR
ncbi:MAG TPA: hypothetical protein VGM51_02235 [Armatimonadota bacterium]